MTRDSLHKLRRSVRAFRDAIRRDQIAAEAYREARQARLAAARELTADLRASDVPEGLGFEEAGLVVWWEDGPRQLDRLGHVFLAFYRGEG